MSSGAGAAHLARLGAASRPSGSAAAGEARTYCADVLRAIGCSISERSFSYSTFPGAWAAPVAGLAVPAMVTALVLARGFLPLAVVIVVLLILGARAGAVLDLPLARRTGINLEATRGSRSPRVWLVAHIDSKWQPVSMLLRVAGVIALTIGVIGVLAAAFVRPSAERAMLVVAWLGGVPLMFSVVGSRNHGTLDNASGVAAVLGAAQRLPRSMEIGVLITDAEEYALAGARAWARSRMHAPAVALNCDSVDDDGPLVVMYTRTPPARLISRMTRAAADQRESLRVLRLIPGILTDSVALAAAGWETLTLSRGTIRTLQRIHTRRDTLDAMRGTGIDGAAAVLARVVMDLADGGPI